MVFVVEICDFVSCACHVYYETSRSTQNRNPIGQFLNICTYILHAVRHNDVIVNMVVSLRGPGWQQHCLYLRASVWACRRLCSSEGVGKQPPREKEITTSTSSLRVDAVAAAGLDIARKYAQLSNLLHFEL